MRSLWHLSRHLTARADDNHAAPSFSPRREDLFQGPSITCFASDIVSPKASIHRLLCGLPGYLILFDPRTFVPERHLRSGKLPTQSVFFVISMHFTATRRIPPTSTAIKLYSINGMMALSTTILPLTYKAACAPFKPNKSG